jgi:hypothetical protein
MNYFSLFKPSDTLLMQRFKESLDPRRAECYLFGESGPRLTELVRQGAEDHGYRFDEAMDKGQGTIEQVMGQRVHKSLKQVQAYLLEEGVFVDEPVSLDPNDYRPFDMANYLKPVAEGGQGGFPIREYWIGNESGDGTINPGIDAYGVQVTDVNGVPVATRVGFPRFNPFLDTEYISDRPGENGNLIWADDFGFRIPAADVKAGAKAKRFQGFMAPGPNGAWGFKAADPV